MKVYSLFFKCFFATFSYWLSCPAVFVKIINIINVTLHKLKNSAIGKTNGSKT